MTWLFGGGAKNFFESKEYQYCFITSTEGDILHSKYKNEVDKKFEKEIETQIIDDLKRKQMVKKKNLFNI